jgi:hypothetical protein
MGSNKAINEVCFCGLLFVSYTSVVFAKTESPMKKGGPMGMFSSKVLQHWVLNWCEAKIQTTEGQKWTTFKQKEQK